MAHVFPPFALWLLLREKLCISANVGKNCSTLYSMENSYLFHKSCGYQLVLQNNPPYSQMSTNLGDSIDSTIPPLSTPLPNFEQSLRFEYIEFQRLVKHWTFHFLNKFGTKNNYVNCENSFLTKKIVLQYKNITYFFPVSKNYTQFKNTFLKSFF